MAGFYGEMQDLAGEILSDDDFNQGVIRYIAPDTPGDTPWYAPTPGTPITLEGAVANGVSQKYLSEKVTSSDIQVTASVFGIGVVGFTPVIGGVVEIDGVERQVVEVKPVPAAGTVVVWKIFVKG